MARVRNDEVARGSTTVLIADPAVHTINTTPRSATSTRTAVTSPPLHSSAIDDSPDGSCHL